MNARTRRHGAHRGHAEHGNVRSARFNGGGEEDGNDGEAAEPAAGRGSDGNGGGDGGDGGAGNVNVAAAASAASSEDDGDENDGDDEDDDDDGDDLTGVTAAESRRMTPEERALMLHRRRLRNRLRARRSRDRRRDATIGQLRAEMHDFRREFQELHPASAAAIHSRVEHNLRLAAQNRQLRGELEQRRVASMTASAARRALEEPLDDEWHLRHEQMTAGDLASCAPFAMHRMQLYEAGADNGARAERGGEEAAARAELQQRPPLPPATTSPTNDVWTSGEGEDAPMSGVTTSLHSARRPPSAPAASSSAPTSPLPSSSSSLLSPSSASSSPSTRDERSFALEKRVGQLEHQNATLRRQLGALPDEVQRLSAENELLLHRIQRMQQRHARSDSRQATSAATTPP